jgi:DNA polymerase-3 subunit epsilon
MIDWLKNITKEYPEFWKLYLKKFNSKSNRFIVFTLETSGVDTEKDVILSIGAITLENNQIQIGKSFEIAILQENYFTENNLMTPILDSNLPKMSECNAIEAFVTYIENAVLVGHRINFDIEILNAALHKMGCGSLKNEALDIEIMHKKLIDDDDKSFAINQLGQLYKLPTPEKQSVTSDAFLLSLLFLKLKSKLGIK